MRGNGSKIAFATLVAIDALGLLWLVWLVGYILYYDGLMVYELLLCAAAIAVLAALTAGGYALWRQGKMIAACVLLAIGALPVVLVGGFLVYLEYNPIVWR